MNRNFILFVAVACLYIFTGLYESWNQSLFILNFSLLSAIMALGVNIQWGYAGLFNIGVMGFTALGGLAVVLVSAPPAPATWTHDGLGRIVIALLIGAFTILAAILAHHRITAGRKRSMAVLAIIICGFIGFRTVFDPAVSTVEAINPALAGNIGGLGLPVLLALPVGGLLAALAAWAVGKITLGLRADYLAIATLGIADIVVTVMKNEDWLARGVKMMNIQARPWPVPFEVDLQQNPAFINLAGSWGLDPMGASAIAVKLCYSLIIIIMLGIILFLSERALNSPWGRMIRAIRDNEDAARAMGKDVTRRHLQIFIIGSFIIGVAGAMLTSMDGILNPGAYNPLRFTFLIWVMVIVGGTGNNWGAILGALFIGWLWLVVESIAPRLMGVITSFIADGTVKTHLINSAQSFRLMILGIILLATLRFSPRGLIPEK